MLSVMPPTRVATVGHSISSDSIGAAEVLAERRLDRDVDGPQQRTDVGPKAREDDVLFQSKLADKLLHPLQIGSPALLPAVADQQDSRRRKFTQDQRRGADQIFLALDRAALNGRRHPAIAGKFGVEIRHHADQRRIGRPAEFVAQVAGSVADGSNFVSSGP